MSASRSDHDEASQPGDGSDPAVHQATGSVMNWINNLKAGDQDMVQPLWDRYFRQLVERARRKH
jgi:hypothetical protein